MTIFLRNKKVCILGFLLLLFLANVFAQERQFNRIDGTSGLSDNSSVCLLQDHNGFIWIGTRDGLNRYDGINFKIYKHAFSDPTSLMDNQINCMIETKDNKMWLGTADGLCMYDPISDSFSRFSLASDTFQFDSYYVWTICETQDGKLWVGTSKGLYIIDKERQNLSFSFVKANPSNPSNGVTKVYEDSSGTVWIGTENGLYKALNGRFQRCYLSTVEHRKGQLIKDIVEAKDGRLWIGTSSSGVYALNTGYEIPKIEFTINTRNSNLPSNVVRSVFFENNENLWIGTLGGLCIYNLETQESTNYVYSNAAPTGAKNKAVQDILSDSQGGIWVATYFDGVNYFHREKNMFSNPTWFLGNKSTREKPIISALLGDGNKNLWIGTEGNGVYHSTNEGQTINKNIKLSDSIRAHNTIKSLALGKENLWIGTLEGLGGYDLETGKVINYYHDAGNNNTLNSGHVSALLYESVEKIWVGINGGGVQLFNPVTSSFKDVDGLATQHIRCFLRDSKNRLWIGSEEGIFLMQGQNLLPLSDLIEGWQEARFNITFIKEDLQGNIWFGTRGRGLYLIKNNQLFWYNTDNGLIDNTVNSLLQSGEHTFWITTNTGLSKIVLEQNDSGPSQIASQTYSVSHGVWPSQFSPNCALKSVSGRLIFGGTNGLVSFNNDDIVESELRPNLVFLDLSVKYKAMQPGEENSPLKKSINETSNLVLEYDQRDFSLSFMGINFIKPDKNYYRYKVEDIDASWIEIGNQTNINFTYFPVGSHKIKVEVSTSPDKWQNISRSLMVTVLPPWWLTWWAFVFYAFFLGGLLYVFFHYSQQWAKLKGNLQMEQFEREKELELNESKLKFFTDVSHELRTPLTLILAPLEKIMTQPGINAQLNKQLSLIQRSGNRMMKLIDQILNLRKLEMDQDKLQAAKGDIVPFLKEISLAFAQIAALRNIDFNYVHGSGEVNVWYDGNKMEIVIYNLLSNAFKHTPSGGKVDLILEIEEAKAHHSNTPKFAKKKIEKCVKISVIDDGEGISQVDLEHIFDRFYSRKNNHDTNKGIGVGLDLTKRMVELHKGRIEVESDHQKGTVGGFTAFSVYIPLGRFHLLESEIGHNYKSTEDVSGYSKEIQLLEKELSIPLLNDGQKPLRTVKGKKQTMLIVEDNNEVRKFIHDLFCEYYDIQEANNGAMGCDMALKFIPDLVISDIMMPIMDGIELCRKLKNDIRTSHIPIVLLTARATLAFKYEGLETGADEYITKPFSAQFLMLRVQNLLKQRTLLRNYYKRLGVMEPDNVSIASVDERLLKKAVDYINKNIENTSISVNELSKELGLSRVHFYRKIKALTNFTAVEFIRNVRLKKAAMLLERNKLSIKEVQNRVGFKNADYFRRCFKAQFGMTPTDYASKNPLG